MTSFSISVVIKQSPEIITQALLHPDNHPAWDSALQRFEVVSGQPGEVGSVGRLHYVQNGKPYTMEDRLEQVEPGKRYISSVTGQGMKIRVDTVLEPMEEGTTMSMHWAGTSSKLLMKLMLPLLRGRMKKAAQTDLQKFKQLVEEYGVKFSKDQ